MGWTSELGELNGMVSADASIKLSLKLWEFVVIEFDFEGNAAK